MRANILLVDDEPSVLRYTKTLLEIDNYRGETAGSGEEAVERIQRGLARIWSPSKRYLVLGQEDVVIEDLQVRDSTSHERGGSSAASARSIGLKALVRESAELDISYKALLGKIKQHGLVPAARERGLHSENSS